MFELSHLENGNDDDNYNDDADTHPACKVLTMLRKAVKLVLVGAMDSWTASQRSLRASQRSLRASQRGLRASERGLRASERSEGQLEGSEGQLEGSEP